MKRIIGAALLGMAAMPVVAQTIDPATLTADPGDRAVIAEMPAMLASGLSERAQLDALLAKLPRPTPLRGIIQTERANVMYGDRDPAAAIAAIEEAMRLLPDQARPKIVASYLLTYGGAAGRAADLWMEASRISPDEARQTDSYRIQALIGRLRETGDRARADRLSARLAEIGFANHDAAERSASALARVREAMRTGREDIALGAVTAIASPTHLQTLYLDRRYAALWSRIEEWAGKDFSQLASRYLAELRADWVANGSFSSALPYARALAARDAPQAVITLFLPLFEGDLLLEGSEDAEYLAPVVANALNEVGRAADADGLLRKVEAAMSADIGGNVLNMQAARVTGALRRADWAGTVAAANLFMNRIRAFGDNVNPAGPLRIEGLRACALWRMGRTAEADRAAASVFLRTAPLPSIAFTLHLCREDREAARRVLTAALQGETHRTWALAAVQPSQPSDTPDAYARLIRPVREQVRTAPEVIAAAEKVGRVLPFAVDERLPAGFDPLRGRLRDRISGASDT